MRFWAAAGVGLLPLYATAILAADVAAWYRHGADLPPGHVLFCSVGEAERSQRFQRAVTFLPLTGGLAFAAGVVANRARARLSGGW